MSSLNFMENLAALRRRRGITQETLANFMGVTKASVSKWETGQSLPDLLLLPQLAGFFDVTVDELLGYEPQLTREQIRKLYTDFASDFVTEPFWKVIESSEKMVKKYYSCYPFLFQMCVLWLNHCSLAPNQEEQRLLLSKITDLCGRIIQGCQNMALQKNAVFLKAAADLMNQKPQEVIDALEELSNPYGLSSQNSGSILIQAYQQTGKLEEAERFAQFSIFQNLQSLLANTALYLTLKPEDSDFCQDFLQKTDTLIAAYELHSLDPNVTAQYQFTAARLLYCQGKKKETLERLKLFVDLSCTVLDRLDVCYLGNIKYFEKLGDISENSDLGNTMLRGKKTILQDIEAALNGPMFQSLQKEPEFLLLRKILKKKGDSL